MTTRNVLNIIYKSAIKSMATMRIFEVVAERVLPGAFGVRLPTGFKFFLPRC